MLRIIAFVVLAIALAGCATQADKRLNQLSQLQAEITKSHDKGNLTDAEYLRLLMATNNTRQEILADQQRRKANALMVFGAGLKNQQQPYQPAQVQPINTGVSCTSNTLGGFTFTDCQ